MQVLAIRLANIPIHKKARIQFLPIVNDCSAPKDDVIIMNITRINKINTGTMNIIKSIFFVMQFLVDIYTWRGAVIIQAGIHLQALISASLLRPISYYQTKLKEVKENVDDEQLRKDSMTSDGSQLAPEALWVSGNIDQITAAAENQQTQIHSDHCGPLGAKISKVIAISFGPLATPAFLCHFLGHYLIQIGHFGILAFLPVRGAWMGVSKQAGAFLPSILGLFSGVGRIMVGFVGDRLPSKRPLISGVSAVIVGVITACSVLVSTYALVAVFSALYGFIGCKYLKQVDAIHKLNELLLIIKNQI